MELKECPLCGEKTPQRFKCNYVNHGYDITCRTCGTYRISDIAASSHDVIHSKEKYILSGITRNNSERNEQVTLSSELNNLIEQYSSEIPRTALEIADHMLLYLYSKQEFFGAVVAVRIQHDYSIGYCHNHQEFNYILNYLQDSGYIVKKEEQVTITIPGLQKIDEITRSKPISDQCFIAMWFNDKMKEAKAKIKEAATEAGFNGLRVDEIEHVGKIDDRIMSEIRKSSLMVADFTGHRGGVYFETGFAMGLGIPIIWTCRKDHIRKLHFDIRQYNCIDWKTPEELKERLYYRIMNRET